MKTHPPVRLGRLCSEDRAELMALFSRLSDADRRSRFMGSTSEASLMAYVAAIEFARTVIIGAWGTDGALVAVVEAFAFDVDGQSRLEAAFTTDPGWRGLGLAKRLFRALAEEAANNGDERIVAQCEARNSAMRALLRSTAAATEVEPGEVCAAWSISNARSQPRPTARAATPSRTTATEIFFSRSVEVGEAQTARRLFATLPLGTAYASRLVPAMATGLLVATIESVCILELQMHLVDGETVVGTDVDIRHLAPALPGLALEIAGSGRRTGSKASFDVAVKGAAKQPIATARVAFAIVDEKRFASKLAQLGRSHSGVDAVTARHHDSSRSRAFERHIAATQNQLESCARR